MRVLKWAALAGLLAASAGAEARLVAAGMGRSWAKAGIGFDQYRADSIACAEQAAAYDLRGSDPARALVVASRMIDNDPTAGPGATIDPNAGPSAAAGGLDGAGSTVDAVRMIGPDRQIAKAGDLMKAALERCLTGKGYSKFSLTREQQRRLAKLPIGSDERHHYLHSLASSREVLERQRAD